MLDGTSVWSVWITLNFSSRIKVFTILLLFLSLTIPVLILQYFMFQTATGNELTLSKANPWKTFPLILLTKQKVLSN